MTTTGPTAPTTTTVNLPWKVYGPDLNGTYGGMQGTGGLEATIMDGTGAATGVLNDYFGNGVATISGGSVTWSPTKVGGYGPLPDSAATPLTDATQLAQSMVWRGHRIDPTGFYYLGARYYEPTSGRFLSPDPLGFAASTSLYAFCGGDCVNNFDPDGRGYWGDVGSMLNGYFIQGPKNIAVAPNNSAKNPELPGVLASAWQGVLGAPQYWGSEIESDWAKFNGWGTNMVEFDAMVAPGGMGAQTFTQNKDTPLNYTVSASPGAGYALVGGKEFTAFGNPEAKSNWDISGLFAFVGAIGIDIKMNGLQPTSGTFFLGVGIGGSGRLEAPSVSKDLLNINVNKDGEVQKTSIFDQ